MTAHELRTKYLKFFESKGHTIIPSASLVPENDPTTLFTGSGMQPMVPYLLGEKHPLGTRIANSQKCFRSQDIEAVGDNRHTTFFEMLGNWSFGDYFKKEQIAWIFEFLTKEIGLDPKNIYITVFRGNEELGIPRDSESVEFWKEEFSRNGMEARDVDFAENKGMQGGRIFYYGDDKNWWSRVGVPNNMPIGEPGGPDSEMFWDFGAELGIHEKSKYSNQLCHVNCDCGRFLEIGNNVFMQYVKTKDGFEPLPKGNIDLGGGLERILAAENGYPDIFKTDLFVPIILRIEKISGEKYGESANAYDMRVIADHLKASTFLIADGVVPINTQRGYVLRRLIRRAVRYGKLLGIENNFTVKIAEVVIEMYRDFYPELKENKDKIFEELEKEEEKFKITLEKGLKEFDNLQNITAKNEKGEVGFLAVDGKMAFNLYQTYGFPIEMFFEELDRRHILNFERGKAKKEFEEEMKKHQELSKTASAGMFKGGLQDTSEETKKLHTAAHLMLAAIREILGSEIYQKGSNITPERLRFDFNYPEKLTEQQIKQIEDLVNVKIQEKIPVELSEMPKSEALKIAKISFDPSKYGDVVKVYKIGDFSVELCGGPHVQNTSELGHFKIQKEESSSAGVRRIKAILE